MEEKKITKAQLEKRIKNAQLIIYKGKDFKAIYFSDTGIGIYICKDFVVASTNFHQNIFNKITGNGYDVPSIFLSQLVDIANEHIAEIEFKGTKGEICYSLKKLVQLTTLSDPEKVIVKVCERFLYIINGSTQAIGIDDIGVANNMIQWIEFITRGTAFIDQKENTEDLVANDFYNQYISLFRFHSLNANISNKNYDKLKDKIKEIETEAYDKIKITVKEMDGEILDTILIKKGTTTEAEALDQLQK